MSNVAVLGGGIVGSAMAIDLAKNHAVTVLDRSREALQKLTARNNHIRTGVIDVTDNNALQRALAPFDLVICAVPGFLGFRTLQTIINAGKNVIDISFFPENALELNKLAAEKGVTAIVDCGVAPGMDNLILGYYDGLLEISHFECLVGGLPKVKKWPFCYKAPFSPIDVIEEYTRPARYIENGALVVREALSDCELVEFEHVGTLEAFNTDGLRSILHTMPHIPNLKEKTLRYPGHVEYINVLKASGFFSEEQLQVGGQPVTPLQFTSTLLFHEWKLGETEEEFTVMRVTVRGKNKNGAVEKVAYHLYDAYCAETETGSMARTTGYTATAAANMFLEGLFKEKGVFPPEQVGRHEACFRYILNYLKERGVLYRVTSTIEV